MAILPPEENQTGAGRTKDASNEKKHDGFEIATLITAIVGVVVLIVYTGATFYQALIARDSEQRQLRAYVYVTGGFSRIEAGEEIDAFVAVHTVGPTPAYDVKAETRGGMSARAVDPKTTVLLPIRDERAILFPTPDELVIRYHSPERPTEVDLFQMRSRDPGQKWWMWGTVIYRDAFGCHQWLNYCFRFSDPELKAGDCNQNDGRNETDNPSVCERQWNWRRILGAHNPYF